MKVFIDHKNPLILGEDEKPALKNAAKLNAADAFKEFEKNCERIRQENEQLLKGFVLMLQSKRLASSTIRKHRDNVDFFINEFLLYTDDAKRPSEGIGEVDEYFGDWFIRKAMWSTPRTIKSSVTSLLKFYDFLAALGKITPEQLVELRQTIALHLSEWQARCERYNDEEDDDWRGIEDPL
jgi:hypothetical protein